MKHHLTAALLITLAGSAQAHAVTMACLIKTGNSFAMNGINLGDQSGHSVSGVGDINGDGMDDFIISAPGADGSGLTASGECYVIFGGVDIGASGPVELSTLNGTNGFVISGIGMFDSLGSFVDGAGDLNGDGMNDLIIGAVGADPNGSRSGASIVVFGDTSIGASGSLVITSLNGTTGFVLNGIDEEDLSGRAVSGAGDVNGDGIDDLIIGAHWADPNGSRSGESYVVFGGMNVGAGGVIELSSLNGTNGFVLNGIDPDDTSGYSVAGAGDVNGDGFEDLLIGAVAADPNGSRSGESYVVFGSANIGASGVMELSSLNGTNGFVLNGVTESELSGLSLSGAGDFNADGFDDLIIGAIRGLPSGRCYVVFGASGVGASGSIELSTLNGANGIYLNGIDDGDQTGASVSCAGDFNGDGVDDLIIGATLAPFDTTYTAESYVVFGGPAVGVQAIFDLASLDGTNGCILSGVGHDGPTGPSGFGVSVSGAGDVNGDGLDDLLIGAKHADPNGSGSGQSYVVFGRTSMIMPITGDISGDCSVNAGDIAILLALWGTPAADLNNDNTTNATDLAILLAAWTG